MFCKCLDCESVILDPELNTSQCPICGSDNFVVYEDEPTRLPPNELPQPWDISLLAPSRPAEK